MRRWYAEHKYGNVSTPEFVALAQQVSRQNLGAFFKAWLYTPGKPAFLGNDDAAPTARVAATPAGRRR
jgi:aminopeptidase N